MEIPRTALNELFQVQPEIGSHVYRAVAAILGGRYDKTFARQVGTLEHGLSQAEVSTELEQ